MPLWFGHINKRVFNKRELKRGVRPVLTHIGRNSGTTYHTPLDAHPIDGGFIFILVYGSESDWVQNVLAASEARLRVGDNEFELVSPQVVTKDVAWKQLPAGTKAPPGFLNITEYLRMDVKAGS